MNKNYEFAGTFYPEKPNEIMNLLNSYKQENLLDYKSKAIIVPHAGVTYSGYAAMAAYQQLDLNENIFIIAPSHHFKFDGIVLPKFTYFDTPLGSLEVNNKVIKEIAEKFPVKIANEPFIGEHSIEVQLPFIQNLFTPQVQSAIDFVKGLKKIGRKIRIIPILTGTCDYRLITDIISAYWENSSFVISSDLSHYYSKDECRQIDTYTAAIIETGKLESFQAEQACGLTAIKGLVEFANNNDCSMIRVMVYNSGDVSNDSSRVVGYGSWFLYEDSKNSFIQKYYASYMLELVRESIKEGFCNRDYIPTNIPPALAEYGASFVTLKINGQLRGCIGSVYPTKPLVLDIIDNARNAAFQDNRFEALTPDEFTNIEITISVLSSITRISYKDEKDLLSKIYPYGIILALGDKRAVYLPIVWEQLPDREVFLNSLKEKAGIPPTYFSKFIEAYRFETTTVSG